MLRGVLEHLWETVKMEEVERVHKSSHITQHVEHIVSKAFMQTEKNLEKKKKSLQCIHPIHTPKGGLFTFSLNKHTHSQDVGSGGCYF